MSLNFILSLFIFSFSSLAKDSLLERANKNVQNADIKFVRHLSDASLKFRRKQYRYLHRDLGKLEKLSQKSPLFKSYAETLKEMSLVFKTQSLTSLASQCSSFSLVHQSHADKMISYLSDQAIEYCDEKIIEDYRSFDSVKNYLRSRVPELVEVSSKKVIRLVKKDLTLRDRLLFEELIKDSLYAKNILPSKAILDSLSIDQKLTRYLQEKKFFEIKDKRIYQRQLFKILADFKEAYLNEEEERAQQSLKEALDYFANHQEYLNSHRNWKTLLNTGKSLLRQDNYEVAINLFEASKEIGEEENQFESKFQAILAMFLKKDYNGVINYALKEKLLENPNITSRLRYWIAYAMEKNGSPKSAVNVYQQQIQHFPMDFYSIVSLKRLQSLSEKNITINNIVKQVEFPEDFKLSSEAFEHISRLVAFSQVGEDRFVAKEVQNLLLTRNQEFFKEKQYQNTETKRKLLITFLSSLEQHLPSFKLAYQSLHHGHVNLDHHIIKSLFPLKYLSQVSKISNKVSPLIVLSLIRQESAFNPRARSRVGARGLMQLMPRTARQYKRRLRTRELYSPNTNLRIGIKYLNRLIKKYDGDVIHALAAYNAGEGNVRRWKDDVMSREDKLARIELIPFEETRNYIKLVYRNYFFYNYLAKEEKGIDVPLDTSFEVAGI